MTVDTWIQAGLALIGTVGGVVAARAARRTKAQERRDDFTAITTQQGNAIERLEKRIERQESEAERQRVRIAGQDATIGYLLGRVRGLVGYIRKAGMEPPAPEPMSDRVREYLQHIDV